MKLWRVECPKCHAVHWLGWLGRIEVWCFNCNPPTRFVRTCVNQDEANEYRIETSPREED